jgi:hypothetical protein
MKEAGMHLEFSPLDADRFWAKVDASGTCWLWIASKKLNGYGQFWLPRMKRLESAHVVSYQMAYGPPPDGYHILHKCPGKDNRACVNPHHLYAGTRKQNMQDRVRNGTDQFGVRNHQSRLTERDVNTIRALAGAGVNRQHIAQAFGISLSNVKIIHRRKAWSHL